MARAVTLKPARQLVVYILPHSHTDIGYTAIQTDIEEKQINNLIQGLADARRTANYPEGARFVWNVEVLWAADLFLHRLSAKQQTEFFEAVKRGQVALNGMYLNELTGLCRPEELIRLFRYSTELGHRAGVPVDSAMISDVPGYTWGTVTRDGSGGHPLLLSRAELLRPDRDDPGGLGEQALLVGRPGWPKPGVGLDSLLGLRDVASLRQNVSAISGGVSVPGSNSGSIPTTSPTCAGPGTATTRSPIRLSAIL